MWVTRGREVDQHITKDREVLNHEDFKEVLEKFFQVIVIDTFSTI